jgi:hypothetical protein
MRRRLVLFRTALLLGMMSFLAACGKFSLGWPDGTEARTATTVPAPPPGTLPQPTPYGG